MGDSIVVSSASGRVSPVGEELCRVRGWRAYRPLDGLARVAGGSARLAARDKPCFAGAGSACPFASR